MVEYGTIEEGEDGALPLNPFSRVIDLDGASSVVLVRYIDKTKSVTTRVHANFF